VGLGLAELLAPAGLARLIGIPNNARSRLILRGLGLRELTSGVGLLVRPESARWLWSRVLGDAMDLALLADGFTFKRARQGRLLAASAAVASVTAIDTYNAARQTRNSSLSKWAAPFHVQKTITVYREPHVVYEFWRDFANLPRFMAHLESVEATNGVSTWRAKGPLGSSISWQAEVVLDRPGQAIGWRSVEGSTRVPNRGVVRFANAPGGRGTEVQVELKYEPPGGALGATFAKLFGEEPSQQIASDLRRLKQVLETGEVLNSDASIHRGPHPARPAERILQSTKGSRA
ncbi:MAG TPA: SRPBCC family protein, partial [Polyangiaceae bacterium]|nr:SRPBCC family protein [Polyangiaceae bacterium]